VKGNSGGEPSPLFTTKLRSNSQTVTSLDSISLAEICFEAGVLPPPTRGQIHVAGKSMVFDLAGPKKPLDARQRIGWEAMVAVN